MQPVTPHTAATPIAEAFPGEPSTLRHDHALGLRAHRRMVDAPCACGGWLSAPGPLVDRAHTEAAILTHARTWRHQEWRRAGGIVAERIDVAVRNPGIVTSILARRAA